MSSGGQIVGGIVGAIVGYVATGFNPYGAFQGAAIGAAIGGYLDPPKGPTVSGPRLQDLAVQTSTYGAFIPRVYGVVPIHGNMLWLENNKLKETARKEESGGKGAGGSSSTLETFTYSATFAIGLCQGPIAGIRRVWCADKLIYNAGSDDLETVVASNQQSAGWRLYLGTDDQMPDPRYEADVGVGNAPAYRGMAYIVFDDFQLADYSNTLQVAQFKFEVMTDSGKAISTIFENTMAPIASADIWGCGGVDESGRIKMQVIDDNILTVYNLNTFGRQISQIIDLNGKSGLFVIKPFTEVDFSYSFLESFGPDVYTRIITGEDYFHSIGYSAQYFAKLGDIHVFTNQTSTIGYSGFNELDNIIFGADNSRKIYTSDIPEGQAVSAGFFGGDKCIISALPSEYIIYSVDVSGTSIAYVEIMRISPKSVWAGFGDNNYWALDTSDYITTTLDIVDSSGVYIYSGSGPTIQPSNNAMSFNDGVMVFINNSDASSSAAYRLGVDINDTFVSAVISKEVEISSLLSSSDIDVSLIDATLAGYRVTGGTIRAALEPLQGAWPFDVRQHGYLTQFLPRGQASVATIPWEDLGATEGEAPDTIIQQSREMDSQLPYRVNVKYLDATREYAISEQYSERLNTQTVNRIDREFPIVMSATKAAGVSETLLFLPWLERIDFSFILPPTYLYLEAGDVVTVNGRDATYSLRLTEINYTSAGTIECKAKPNNAAVYLPNAEGAEIPGPGGTIPLGGPSLFLPLDIPVVDETFQNTPGFIGAVIGVTTGWPGAILIRSTDQGQTWADLQAFTGKSSIGIALDTLPVSTGTMIDESEITVVMASGTLSSITKDQMLAGQNYAAYGVNGRWEIIRFRDADLQADGSYIVSGFVRGECGTEWATGLHSPSDYFVLLDDPDMAFMGAAVATIGTELTYRAITAGASIDSASDQLFTYNGVNLECLSPVYASGSRDGSSNFTGAFTRRSRLSSSWWITGVEAPLGETSQSYEIDVMNGSAVVRTIATTTPSFAYSAAEQTTDLGSPQSSITFRIYQLSGTVGRGYPYEVTL